MKEELQGKLVEILTSIQTATGKAADFAMEQLPDIAQSYVVFGRVYGLLLTSAGLALLCAAAYLVLLGVRAYRRGESEYRQKHPTNEYRILYRDKFETGLVQFVAGLIASIFGLSVFLSSLGPTLLVWFAPKVWLLKEIAHLVK
jgi:Ca2+/Na+ antiporter